MASKPTLGQGGLPPYPVPHSFTPAFQPHPHPPVWPIHASEFIPMSMFQQFPRTPSPPVQGPLGRPLLRCAVPALSYPPVSSPLPNYPSPGRSLYAPWEQMEANSRAVQYGRNSSLFFPDLAEHFAAHDQAAQYGRDPTLMHMAARAAKNGITLEAPPSLHGSVSGAEIWRSVSSRGDQSFPCQPSGSAPVTKRRLFLSLQRAGGSPSQPQQSPLALASSTGSGCSSSVSDSAISGCTTSSAGAGLPACTGSLADISYSHMAMYCGLYKEHCRYCLCFAQLCFVLLPALNNVELMFLQFTDYYSS